MSTPLFPTASNDLDDTVEGPAPEGRWSLHRAGIVNVWQYDRVELRFAGGRMLLRGKNGAGKSKALEVLLPFLFDGDTRLLDANGRDRTTVTWLMTDGRPAGHHVGYVWLELRCVPSDGTPAFLTLGAGLKASTATRKADSWFFITDRRVGVDVELDIAGECLSIDRLKATIGEDAVTASGAEHRRRVGRHVFGLFNEARYRNLLHLLHRLRDPNIGNRVEAGELAEVLSSALPPIDERVLTEAAGHFDDLDTIRDQVDRSSRTAQALGQFLATYRGYTRTVLSRRAAAVTDAEARRARAARQTQRLTRAVDHAGATVEDAQAALDAYRRERAQREAERRELERSDGYRAHQDLLDRQGRVEALAVAARATESAAQRAEDAHGRTEAEVEVAQREVGRSLTAATETATAAAGMAAGAGLDPALLGQPPDVDDLATAEDRARAARTLVDTRRRRAVDVRQLAQRAEQAAGKAVDAEESAAASEADVDRQRDAVRAAGAACDSSERAWVDAVTAWMGTGVAGSLTVSWDEVVGRLADRTGEPTWTSAVSRAVVDAIEPALQAARHGAADAALEVAHAEEAVGDVQARLADAEAQPEARPVPGPYRSADRDPAAGTPFYELVDVAPGVDPSDAAGLEAALEAAGLLDAWVRADGLVVHPDTRDVLLRADTHARPPGSATLANVLVPATAGENPVSRNTIEGLLSAVAVGEQPDAPAWVTTGGRWGLGVLRGAWRKQAVEYLGAAARRSTRERLLAQLRSEVEACEATNAAARAQADAAAERRDRIEALPGSVPPAGAIEEATRELATAERGLAAARARFDTDRRRAEEARAAANRLAAEAAHRATGDGLPTATADLDRVIAALADLRDLLAEHTHNLRDLVRDHDRLQQRRADGAARRGEADAARTEAHRRRDEHDTAAHELATLRRALAATVDAVLAQHGEVTARLDALDGSLIPGAESAQRAADAALATAAAQLDAAHTTEGEAVAALDIAGETLAAAVALPGVLLAATGRDPDDLDRADAHVALAVAIAPLVDGDDEVSDGVILSRYDRLSEALAGGYDTAIDEHGGVKVVHVADDTGRQPLAVVAARLADEAENARGRLAAREREVLERFLLRELADEVRSKLLDAHDLVAGTNRTLSGVRTSHGKGAHLEWKLRDDAAAPSGVAVPLLIDNLRDEVGDAQLRDALLALIDAERTADPTAGYEQHLRAALDYRGWHRFTVKVTDTAHPGSSRTLSSRLGLSQGEQRVLSYLALFAAAAAQFEAIARDTPTAPRLLLLDDAFAKVDEPTHAHLLGLLVDLGLDFVLTSERMWGCFPSVPSLEIYEAVRDPAHPGVALVHFRWDGRQRHLVGV